MTYQQVQSIEATARKVHHDLGNLLMTVDLVLTKFDTLAPEKKARYERDWRAVYVQAAQDLQALLVLLDQE